MSSSTPFSATLDLTLSRSRLQSAVLCVLGLAPLAIPLLLPLEPYWRIAWIIGHGSMAAVEAVRAGLLAPRRRIVGIARRGEEWRLEYADGRRVAGRLRRSWVTPWGVYLEVGSRRHPRSLTVWRDSVPRPDFRHLRTHLRLG